MNMDFSEKTKKEVKEKAAFRCCRCQQIGVHVHHILPKEDEGSSDINNAAPLCPSCHDYYGGNPQKRKEITQMRDWWYEQVEKQFPDNRQLVQLGEINDKVDKLQQNQISLDDFKIEMGKFAEEAIKNVTMGTAVTTASGIANATVSPSASMSPSQSPSLSPSPSPSFPPPESED